MAVSPAHQVLTFLHTQRHADNVKPMPANFDGNLTETEIQQALTKLTEREFINANSKLTIRGSMALMADGAEATSTSVPKAASPATVTEEKPEVTPAEIPEAPATPVQTLNNISPADPEPQATELHISPTHNNQTKTNNMAQSIKPLGARVLVKRVEAEEKTAGGLFLPDTAKEKPQEAEVIELGTGGRDDDGKLIDFNVKKGDIVLISKYGGTEVKVDGADLLIISESDILGIVTK